MNYYHIRIIWTRSYLTYYAYEVNLSEIQVKNIGGQFERGEPLWFDGKRIDAKEITEMRVYQTDLLALPSTFWHSFPNGYKGDFGGTDVTRSFITKPPLSDQNETQRLASKLFWHIKKLSLDENWSLATIALQLQEIALVIYSKKFGIVLDKSQVEKILGKSIKDLTFNLKYAAFSKEVERLYKVHMPIMAKGFREMRTEVLHRGYNPKEEETNAIISFTNGFLKKLGSIKLN